MYGVHTPHTRALHLLDYKRFILIQLILPAPALSMAVISGETAKTNMSPQYPILPPYHE